jgi:hypothetical protein
LKALLGQEVTLENLEAALKKHGESLTASQESLANKKISELCEQLEKATAQVKELTTRGEEQSKKISSLEVSASLGEAYLKKTREDAATNYKLAKGTENVKEVILKTLDTSPLEVVLAWNEEFKAEAESKYALVCKDCQSKNVSRQSSATEDKKEEKQAVMNPETAKSVRSLHVV